MVINSKILLQARPIKDMVPIKAQIHGTSYGLSEAGYDIRIKQQIHFSKNDNQQRVVGKHKNNYDCVRLFSPGRFIIASAIEEFDMPNNLVGVVHDKSTWARRGLSVFNTVIEPGWKGFLTLELVYHGSEDLVILAGSGIAQVIFSQLATPCSYAGKYQNQEDEPIPARDS